MVNLPKIRILWIDDRERVSGYPQKLLPENLSKWFEVVHPSSSGEVAMSYSSASEFMKEFKPFWFRGATDFLPVEIIATDYVLRKQAGATRGSSQPTRGLNQLSDDNDEDSVKTVPAATKARPQKEKVDFDGLLIGSFYATLTYRHPSTIVSITHYPGDMPSEVDTLSELMTPFLSVATKHYPNNQRKTINAWQNLKANERSWQNIVKTGLDPLRKRIIYLYNQGHIIIPPKDLFSIIDGNEKAVVRLNSPHASRSLPIEGLFWDGRDNPKEWARSLLESKITKHQYIESEKIAKEIWSNYNNDALIDEYVRFSSLHLSGYESVEYFSLAKKFNLTKTSQGKSDEAHECTAHCSEIRKNNCSSEEQIVRRWAALFLIRKLFKRMLLFIDAMNITSISREGIRGSQSLAPTVEEDDILLLLFPVPTSPFPPPWHINDAKMRNNKKSGWQKWMKNNLGFQPKDVLDGSVLRIGEQQILQGMVMGEDIELGPNPEARLERWRSFEPARLFLFGHNEIVGSSGEANANDK